ncbi:sulfur dehydrogenase subunit SoxC [Cupriavidus gilardii J11]|uniref:Sulfur dehydrogenase subunit SoxC n=1 Tax=Cupriavidus gilardii J11 TaxID=936133 RepID=A0A562B351_9BURK|nr:sulfite dehydrogenase [Cupriavidus gilardii]TWG79504.1 sulfur dehydrogenase subunit SoxC [Cupriavidus gilardii J11]
MPDPVRPGRIVPAPEHFIDAPLQREIARHGVDERRRALLRGSFAAAAATVGAARLPRAVAATEGDEAILKPQPWATSLGQPVAARPYGMPSRHESAMIRRESPGLTRVSAASVSFAPLQGLFGIITPNGLHFERHHQGWHDIDPARHRLMINGLVKTPRVYTMDELMRLPSVSRMHFIECGANTGMEWGNVAVPTVQYTHGMLSCCEFTGVPLSVLLDDAGADRSRGRFLLAEGGDGSSMTRTIPMELADEIIVAWGMNGEMLRPENGYPLRLVVPGVQGVSWVKWLRRLELGDRPWNTKDETLHYVDMMPDGILRQYTSVQECKSVITTPSGGQRLVGKGYYNVSGLAWSGRGKVRRVDVSTDGGRNWRTARLESPVLSKCLTRFNIDWVWNGEPSILQSRAIDDTGYVQPTIAQLRAVRGTRSIYHNNAIQSWLVSAVGEVSNVQVQ